MRDFNDHQTLLKAFYLRYGVHFTGGGRDVLSGDDGNDFLHGGSGNDTFFGDEGNDTLIDTEGFDIYHITDHDTIYDSDGKGEIVFEGGLLKDAAPIPESFKRIAHGLWYAQDAEDRILYTATKIGNDLLITSLQDSDNRITLKDFFNLARHQNNTLSFLNIHLQQSPTLSNTPSHLDLYTNPDYVANVYTGGITPMPTDELDRLPRMYTSNKGDNIFASGKQAYEIHAGDGSDLVFGSSEADVIHGGEADDVINGSSVLFESQANDIRPKADHDTIYGGQGNDMIFGGIGMDVIYADDEYHTTLNNGTEKGDWILGGSGSDVILGSQRQDFLQGGADNDSIYGGGGDDVVLGDGHVRFDQKSKTVFNLSDAGINYNINHGGIHPLLPPTITPTLTVPNQNTLSMDYMFKQDPRNASSEKAWRADNLQSVYFREKDTFDWKISIATNKEDYVLESKLAPSSTDHALYSDVASDTIYGGLGNDLLIGQYGDDMLHGGLGNDILYGDDNRDSTIKGDDTLQGGTGADRLMGGQGFDTYVFDVADVASAQDNKTIIDADGQGRIVLAGVDLSGTQFFKTKDDSNLYQTQDGTLTLTHHGDSYILTGTSFNASILIEGTPAGQDDTLLGMILTHEVKNTAPTVQNPISDVTLLAGQDVSLYLGGTFFDAEDGEDKLIYGLTGAEGWHFDPATKMLTGRAPDKGTFHLTLTGTDSQGESATTRFNLNVNQKPTLISALTLPSILSADAITQLDVNKLFVDPEGDALTYTLSAHAGVTLEGDKLIINPALTSVGTHAITLTATDSFGQSTSTTATLTVKASEPPKESDISPILPTQTKKTITGTLFKDTLTGDDNDNVIKGLTGNDTLYGRAGHDILEGGLGNDTYVYQRGDGKDIIRDVGGTDTLKLEGLTLSEVGISRVGDDLSILISGSDEGVIIDNYFNTNPLANSSGILGQWTTQNPFLNSLATNLGKRVGTHTIESIHLADAHLDHTAIHQMLTPKVDTVI